MNRTTYIFAGPSLFDAQIDPSDTQTVKWLPPARRGDIERLVSEVQQPGVIGLADGTFHSYPSVRHIELRDAIGKGWLVYGLCSMGAIRACEMSHLGMRPFGSVAAQFCANPSMADDEVALIHGSEYPYLPITEPLVHIRAYLEHAQAAGLITQEQHERLTESLRNRWYGHRSLENVAFELRRELGAEELPKTLGAALDDFTPFRLKQRDLRSFVTARPWLDDQDTPIT